ncbi:MAG TPA: class I SAM-dependent methyltransferase [Candidatus Didemnitutus sp.]|jgi:ubiquinone/menaquinone biosynthesis C-methylase UbiE
MPRSFDRLARPYRLLELVAFGSDLERARFAHLELLRNCRSILVAGEGDGRCLRRLLAIAPHARITCVDASARMIDRARERVAGFPDAAARVDFIHADARAWTPDLEAVDAVVTLFFLDCFDAAECTALIDRWAPIIRPDGYWMWADFALPTAGWRRARARAWLTMLYAFFRWQTGLAVRALPPAETILADHNLAAVSALTLQHGMLRSVAFRRMTKNR